MDEQYITFEIELELLTKQLTTLKISDSKIIIEYKSNKDVVHKKMDIKENKIKENKIETNEVLELKSSLNKLEDFLNDIKE
jgi:hypothetical protein